MFVPSPSFASTDALVNEMVAELAALTLNTNVTTVPLCPFQPGLGTMPWSVAVPLLFEYVGSSAQNEMMLLVLEIDCKVRSSAGNRISVDTAFNTSLPSVETRRGTDMVCPMVALVPPESVSVAALAYGAKPNTPTKSARMEKKKELWRSMMPLLPQEPRYKEES